MITRKNIIDRIRRAIYGGIPPDSAEITVNLVNSYLNDGIAAAAKKNFQENFAVDQIGSVADGFYMTFSPFTISHDDVTGYYGFDAPQMPLSLPAGINVSNLFVVMPSKIKVECSRITTRDLQVMFEVPMDTREIYYWLEGMKVMLWSKGDITGSKAYMRMPYAESSDLNAAINCPPDMIPDVTGYVLQMLGVQAQEAPMTQNENVELRNISRT